jgi:hypothetical protein
MRWNDLMKDARGFAEVAHRRLIDPGVLLVSQFGAMALLA